MKMKQNTNTDVRYKNSIHESNYRDVRIYKCISISPVILKLVINIVIYTDMICNVFTFRGGCYVMYKHTGLNTLSTSRPV